MPTSVMLILRINMFRIGDFSKLAQVSIRALRHYDELNLLAPAHVDDLTDYRYYAVEQLPKIHRIVALKEMGFSLQEIQTLTEDSLSLDELKGMLERKQSEVTAKLKAEQERLMLLEARLKHIELEAERPAYDITLKKVSPLKILSKRQTVPHIMQMSTFCTQFFTELFNFVAKEKLSFTGHPFILYHTDGFTLENIDVEVCIVPDGESLQRLELAEPFTLRNLAGTKQMASLIHHGYFHELDRAAEALLLWLGENGYHSAGAAREIHLSGPITQTGKDSPVVVEIQIPITAN